MDAFALPTFELSLAAAGFRDAEGRARDIRTTLGFARSAGYHAVQLNAADPLTRPRDLSRSARRDVAAHIRRHELVSSGVDLWIPKAHFSDPAKIDHAISALVDAVGFAADLGELTGGDRLVATSIPWESGATILSEVAVRAVEAGVLVANHAFPWPESLASDGPIRVGIDPAEIILASGDPSSEVSRASTAGVLGSARLCDLASSGRVAPGEGALDLLSYRVALATGLPGGTLVVDVRGLASEASEGGQSEVARRVATDLGRERSG